MSSTVLDMLSAISGVLPAIDDGSLRLSYADVQRSVAAERRWFQSLKVRRCALLAENSARWILSDLALLASEAVNVPLLPSLGHERVAQVLEDAGIEWVLTDSAERFTQDHPAFSYVATSHRTGLALLRRDDPPAATSSWPKGISKVIYPSDRPQGVSLKHNAVQAVTDSLVADIAGLGVQTHLCLLPLADLLENIVGVHVSLTMGAKVIARPRHTMGVNHTSLKLPLLLQAIDAASPDSMVLTPELLHALVAAIRDGWRAPESVKFIAVGGVVSPELFQEARHAGLPHRDAEVRSVDLGAIDAGRFVYLRDPVRNVS
ncbi:AMP-binding protein [Peristeroidobacter soli]|uniref:AMP-binding protein n=1 Tax=Peristeroidobacter soli TaxID=2497877 RepID=UPI0013005260|nr:AMP-binding protein [Peristeroidobacter soli]